MVFAYAGGALGPLAQMQPYRLLVPATMMTTIPAAGFVSELARGSAFRRLTTGPRMLLIALSVVVGQHLLQDMLYFLPRTIPETDRFSDGSPSPLHKYGFFTRGFGPSHVTYSLPHDPLVEPPYGACIRWLESNAEQGSRLLVQGSVLGERLAWRTSFEVLGGFLERNVEHAYANYFRRHAESGSADELAKYLRTYAVDYVISYAPPPEFEHSDALVPIKTIGAYRIYRVEPRPNRVLEGPGLVKARTNRLEVLGSDPQQSLLLSYHFHETLRCSPQCAIERAPDVMGPVGAIRVPAPHPRDFTIYNAYDWNRD